MDRGDKVALINMPFASAFYPAIGISLLQAALRRDGIPCDLYYFDLLFASKIGFDSYRRYSDSASPCSLVGDWLFARTFFGERLERDSEYIHDILSSDPNCFDSVSPADLDRVRAEVPGFLHECLHATEWSHYRIVGFTSSFQQNLAALAFARLLKEVCPQLVVVFGGANCEAEMGIELHRQFGFIDFVCSGEGDHNFPQLTQQILKGGARAEIDGIIMRQGDQTVVPQKIVAPVFDLDALPIPSYDDYFAQLRATGLDRLLEPLVPFESSRGCWWGAKMHCTFCGLNGSTMAYRSKSAERALQEVVWLGQKYGRDFFVVDNIFDLKYLDSFFPELAARKLGFTFYYETKVNLKKHQVRLLAEAGANYLQPGIESLSTPILRLMKKGCTLLQNLQCMKWGKQYGITISWNLLYGFPGEDPAEYEKMADLIPSLLHLDPPDFCARVRLDRHSPYFTRPQDYGLRHVRAQKAYSYVYPLAEQVLNNIAYYFDFDHELNNSVDQYAKLLTDRVTAWQQSSCRGELTATGGKHELVLTDTRVSGQNSVTTLEEPLRSIYLFCDEIKSFSAIKEYVSATLPESGMTDSDLESALNRLVEGRLMATEGAAYLSLAVVTSHLGEPGEAEQTRFAIEYNPFTIR
jgi:ribosomal peptide maturation radical SAM protein 1